MGMFLENTGSINLHKDIEEEDLKVIKEFSASHGYEDFEIGVWAYAPSEIQIYIEEQIDKEFLDELKTTIEALGYDILSSSYIETYGDHKGGWFFEDGEFIFRDENAMAIHWASDEQLIKEIEKRGYEVHKYTVARRCDICEEDS